MTEALIDQVHLRYTGKGHVRFSLPPQLCAPEAALRIEQGLIAPEGVYRVKVSREGKKLSVRYREDAIGLNGVGLRLKEIIEAMPPEAMREAADPPGEPSGRELPSAQAIIGRLFPQTMKIPARLLIDRETEKKAITVINEVVLFYLIKRHWSFITGSLIKHPVKNTGGWLTIFYLFFLYVRSKKEY